MIASMIFLESLHSQVSILKLSIESNYQFNYITLYSQHYSSQYSSVNIDTCTYGIYTFFSLENSLFNAAWTQNLSSNWRMCCFSPSFASLSSPSPIFSAYSFIISLILFIEAFFKWRIYWTRCLMDTVPVAFQHDVINQLKSEKASFQNLIVYH